MLLNSICINQNLGHIIQKVFWLLLSVVRSIKSKLKLETSLIHHLNVGVVIFCFGNTGTPPPALHVLLLTQILTCLCLRGMSISWQEMTAAGIRGSTWELFPTVRNSSPRRKCQYSWETWELLYKKEVEDQILALLTAALHQLSTLKDACRACTPTVLLRRPHSSSADGLDAEGIQACSLKVSIHRYLLTNSRACRRHFIPLLGRSFVASAPVRIRLRREHVFHWFHIMSLKRFHVNYYREKKESLKPTFLPLLMSAYKMLHWFWVLIFST